MSEPRKVFVADNPWPLAAKTKDAGLPTKGRFYECDGLPADKVYVIDLDAMTGWLGSFAARLSSEPSRNTLE